MLAILVTLILLAIGAAIIAYFTLFVGGTTAPIVAIKGQPIVYREGVNNAKVEVVIVNIGNAPFTIGDGTTLTITYPNLGTSKSDQVGMTIHPGESRTLTFTFTGAWSTLKEKDYRAATGVLKVVDPAGNTVAMYEISIRVVASS